MHRRDRRDLLIVAVRTGVVVGIGNVWIILVVVLGATGLEVVRVKMIELTERAEMRETKPKILVVARG